MKHTPHVAVSNSTPLHASLEIVHPSQKLGCIVILSGTTIQVKTQKIRDSYLAYSLTDRFNAEIRRVGYAYEPEYVAREDHNYTYFDVSTPVDKLDSEFSWMKENIRAIMQFAMLATWAPDQAFYRHVTKACYNIDPIRPMPGSGAGSGSLYEEMRASRQRQAPSDGAMVPAIRPRQEMSGGFVPIDPTGRVVRPRQEMSDGSGAAYEVVDITRSPNPKEERIKELVSKAYPTIFMHTLSRNDGKITQPPPDGRNPRARQSISKYLEDTNDSLLNAESTEQGVREFWRLWQTDKLEFKDKELKSIHIRRIDFLLTGINHRWETSFKARNVDKPLKRNAVFNGIRGDDKLDTIIRERLFPESRDYVMSSLSFTNIAAHIYQQLSSEYHDNIVANDQAFMVTHLHEESRRLKDVLLPHVKKSATIKPVQTATGFDFSVEFLNHHMTFQASVSVTKARDVKFKFNGPLSPEELAALSDNLFSTLRSDVPEFERMDVKLTVARMETMVECFLTSHTDVRLKCDTVDSLFNAFTETCLVVFITASTKVLTQLRDEEEQA